MQRLRVRAAAVGVAATSFTAVVAAPLVPITQAPPDTVRQVRLAATTVPPGGLIISVLHNQGIYCSIICPLLVQTATTAVSSALGAPGEFLAALPADGLLRALGFAVESITGPTDAAAEKAIAADAAIPAQRALNAFEVGVVGLLDVASAFGAGPGAVLAAIGNARQQTFDALNAPVVPNPVPTVMPHGLLQIAVVEATNVVAAVIFPAFNDVLAGAFQIPDAVARALAATGNPVMALVSGLKATAKVLTAAGTTVAKAVVTAIDDIRAAAPSAPNGTASVEMASVAESTSAAPHLSRRGGQLQLRSQTAKLPAQTDRAMHAKPSAHAKAAAHRSERGSHSGRPSRPARRAKR